jgi:hypothetical protein
MKLINFCLMTMFTFKFFNMHFHKGTVNELMEFIYEDLYLSKLKLKQKKR